MRLRFFLARKGLEKVELKFGVLHVSMVFLIDGREDGEARGEPDGLQMVATELPMAPFEPLGGSCWFSRKCCRHPGPPDAGEIPLNLCDWAAPWLSPHPICGRRTSYYSLLNGSTSSTMQQSGAPREGPRVRNDEGARHGDGGEDGRRGRRGLTVDRRGFHRTKDGWSREGLRTRTI